MNKTIMTLGVAMLVLSACGGGDKKSSTPPTTTSSSVSSSSSSVATNTMELNKEYTYTANTKITNTGTTDLVVTKKHYWQEDKTVVILKEGSATID